MTVVMTTYQPRNAFVLVLGDSAETRRGGLILISGSNKVPSRGTVVALGPGYILADGTRAAIDLQVDDRVEFHLTAATHVIKEKRERLPTDEDDADLEQVFFVLEEKEILLVVTDEPAPMLLPDVPVDAATDEPQPDAHDLEFHAKPRERIVYPNQAAAPSFETSEVGGFVPPNLNDGTTHAEYMPSDAPETLDYPLEPADAAQVVVAAPQS